MPQRRFSFILPVDWWRIPLVNESTRLASIEALLDKKFPNKDEKAQLRHDLRTTLRDITSQSAVAGGMVMAFYLPTFTEQPIAATMTCYDVSGLAQLPPFIDPRKILAGYVGDHELDESLPALGSTLFPADVDPTALMTDGVANEGTRETVAADDQDNPQPWDKVTGYNVLAYRRMSTSPGTDYFGQDAPKIPTLQFTYSQVVPDFGLVTTAFSTPVTQAPNAWQKMFDAIVATFRNGVIPGVTPQPQPTHN